MVAHGQEKKARVLYVDLQAEGRESQLHWFGLLKPQNWAPITHSL